MAKGEFDFELEPIDDEADMAPPALVPERPRRMDPSLENAQTKIMERRRIIEATGRARPEHPRGPGFFGRLFRFLVVLLIGFAGGAAATVYVQTERQELYDQLLGIARLKKSTADESAPAAEENDAESNAAEKAKTEPATNAQPSATSPNDPLSPRRGEGSAAPRQGEGD